MLLNQSNLWGQKILHILKFTFNTFNTNIVRPFFSIKMRWYRFSIPNLECQKLVMTLATLKMHLVSIYEPTIPSTWRAKKTTCGNWVVCWPHQAKGFSIFYYITHNWQNNYSSFFRVDLITSSLDIICPQKNHHLQLLFPQLHPCKV